MWSEGWTVPLLLCDQVNFKFRRIGLFLSMRTKLQNEFDYFVAHQDELVKLYRGKQIVIKGAQVIGAYDTLYDAYHETAKTHKPGTFAIQLCEEGEECYTATILRAVF